MWESIDKSNSHDTPRYASVAYDLAVRRSSRFCDVLGRFIGLNNVHLAITDTIKLIMKLPIQQNIESFENTDGDKRENFIAQINDIFKPPLETCNRILNTFPFLLSRFLHLLALVESPFFWPLVLYLAMHKAVGRAISFDIYLLIHFIHLSLESSNSGTVSY